MTSFLFPVSVYLKVSLRLSSQSVLLVFVAKLIIAL